MITVECSCGRTFEVDDRFAGRSARCPNCKASVDVPPSEPMAQEPESPPEQPATDTQAPPAEKPAPAGPATTAGPAQVAGPAPARQMPTAPVAATGPAPIPASAFPQPPVYGPRATTRPPTTAWILIFCILALATIVVPWELPKSPADGSYSPVWSWERIEDMSNTGMVWVIVTWASALLGLVLALALRRWALAACLGVLGLALMTLLFVHVHEGAARMVSPRVAGDEFWQFALFFAGLSALMGASAARVRVGASVPSRIVQALAAVAGGVALGFMLYESVPEYVDTLKKAGGEGAGTLLVRLSILSSVSLLGEVLLALACLLGFLHAVIVTIRTEGMSTAVTGLIGGGLTMIVLSVLAAPAMFEQPAATVSVFVMCALPLLGPVLLAAGVNRLLGEATLAMQKAGATA